MATRYIPLGPLLSSNLDCRRVPGFQQLLEGPAAYGYHRTAFATTPFDIAGGAHLVRGFPCWFLILTVGALKEGFEYIGSAEVANGYLISIVLRDGIMSWMPLGHEDIAEWGKKDLQYFLINRSSTLVQLFGGIFQGARHALYDAVAEQL